MKRTYTMAQLDVIAGSAVGSSVGLGMAAVTGQWWLLALAAVGPTLALALGSLQDRSHRTAPEAAPEPTR